MKAATLMDRARTLLLGRSPAQQLTEIRERIAAAEAETARLDGEIGRRAMPIMTGDVEAARTAAQFEGEKQALLGELRTLRAAEADRLAAVGVEEEAARRAAAEALPAGIARLNAAILALDDEIEGAADALASAIKRRVDLGRQLAALVGSQTLARANQTTPNRVRSAISRKFLIDTAAPHTLENNLLHLKSDEVGPRAWATLRQLDEIFLDDEAAFFNTVEEAQAARERLAARGTPAAIVPIGACWAVERADRLFTDRTAAETAPQGAQRLGRDDVIVPHGPGFLLRNRRFADAAVVAGAGA